ncbi:MAG: AtpZ/AtpI family protein [Oligoflexia bacterium]|nr:AtpZ/AtpI family protein [Oligoflexia bacterium]
MKNSAYGVALVLGLELGIGVAVFSYIGLKIDRYLGYNLFVIILPILALTAGMFRLYYGLKKFM